MMLGEVKKAINGNTAPILKSSAKDPKIIKIEIKKNLIFLSLPSNFQNLNKVGNILQFIHKNLYTTYKNA